MNIPSILKQHSHIMEACHRYASNQSTAIQRPLSIAVCGLYNAGKSSLLNILAGEFEAGSEAFEIGAARVTTQISKKQVGNLVYIDTPGIDGSAEDDETAWTSLLSADYLLYVHSMRSMEFELQETEFLQALQQRIQGIDKRLVLVMTQIDTLHDTSATAAHRRSILQAFQSASGFLPRHTFSVSSTRFIKGTLEQKPKLVDLSGIAELKDWVTGLGSPGNMAEAQRFRMASLETERLALLGLIQPIAESLQRQYRELRQVQEAKTQAFDTASANLVLKVRRALARIDKP